MLEKNSEQVHYSYSSDKGGRVENQDNYGYAQNEMGSLAIVCDGVGGSKGGGRASQMAVEITVTAFNNESCIANIEQAQSFLESTINAVHQAICQEAEIQNLPGMATTIAIAFVINRIENYSRTALIAHVGDSRVYHLRKGRVLYRTKDHSLIEELLETKAITKQEATTHPSAHVITRALGMQGQDVIVPSIAVWEQLYANDIILLCSDGVWNMLKDKELARFAFLPEPVSSIIKTVNERGEQEGGNHDNVTVEILKILPNEELLPAPEPWQHLFDVRYSFDAAQPKEIKS